jgi:formylglycine-generating enzyme required for sulfatase activity
MPRKDLILVDEASGRRQVVAAAAPGRFVLSAEDADALTLPGLAPGWAAALDVTAERLTIEPIGAATALWVNQQPVTETPRPLDSGDRIQLGDIVLVYKPTAAAHELVARKPRRAEAAGDTTPPDADAVPAVTPLTFAPREDGAAVRRRRRGWLWLGILFLPAVLLATAAWFVFTARQLELAIDPQPADIDISGGLPALPLGTAYLLRPGTYRLRAVRPGYQDLEADIAIGADRHQTLAFQMQKLPGRIDLNTYREDRPTEMVTGAVIKIGGQVVGRSPLEDAAVPAGRHAVRIEAPLYQPREADITVAGEDRHQTFSFGLEPDWADVQFSTAPPGAWVEVAGQRLGRTPLTAPVQAGRHEVHFRLTGYKPATTRIRVDAGQALAAPLLTLRKIDGRLFVTSQPAGANVTIDNWFRGQTPLDVPVPAARELVVRISEPGYQTAVHRIAVASGERTSVAARLKPRRGKIRFTVTPPDARLLVNDKPYGRVPESLDLLAVDQRLTIVKDGYRTYRTRVTPRPGHVLELQVALKRPYETDVPGVIQAPNGYRLTLIQPGAFRMGSSRREPGRRANETLRDVRLRTPFYMGLKEVTNREFREFQDGHDAGIFKNYSLNRNDLPAVQITWEQAAAFCNWLSRREGLPAAYVRRGGRLVAATPLTHGYRLPTEAEWAFCARVDASGAVAKYAWGNAFPPPAKSANLADRSAQTILTLVLDNYLDGHPVAAPPGSLAANHRGLYDLGGNVAEWCHDFYKIYPYTPGKTDIDPTGPATGRHHVVRGGSWRQASMQTLRAAYRDYQENKRLDIGFRIGRYVTPRGKDN